MPSDRKQQAGVIEEHAGLLPVSEDGSGHCAAVLPDDKAQYSTVAMEGSANFAVPHEAVEERPLVAHGSGSMDLVSM